MPHSTPFGRSPPLTHACSAWCSTTSTSGPPAGASITSPPPLMWTTPCRNRPPPAVARTAEGATAPDARHGDQPAIVHRRRPRDPRRRRQLPLVLASVRRRHPQVVLGHVGPHGAVARGHHCADLPSTAPL